MAIPQSWALNWLAVLRFTHAKYFKPSRVINEIIGVITWRCRNCLALQNIRPNPTMTNTNCRTQAETTAFSEMYISVKLDSDRGNGQHTDFSSWFARAGTYA